MVSCRGSGSSISISSLLGSGVSSSMGFKCSSSRFGERLYALHGFLLLASGAEIFSRTGGSWKVTGSF